MLSAELLWFKDARLRPVSHIVMTAFVKQVRALPKKFGVCMIIGNHERGDRHEDPGKKNLYGTKCCLQRLYDLKMHAQSLYRRF